MGLEQGFLRFCGGNGPRLPDRPVAASTLIPDANAFARFILPAFNELSRLVEDRKQTPSSDTTLETGGISEIAVVD